MRMAGQVDLRALTKHWRRILEEELQKKIVGIWVVGYSWINRIGIEKEKKENQIVSPL